MQSTVLTLTLLLCLSGCAGKRISQTHAAMHTWLGRTEADLIQVWGNPPKMMRAKDVKGAPACVNIIGCVDTDRVFIYTLTREVGGYYRAATPATTQTTVTQKPGVVIPLGGGMVLDTSKVETTTTTTPGREAVAFPSTVQRSPRIFWINGEGKVFAWYWRDWDGMEWFYPYTGVTKR